MKGYLIDPKEQVIRLVDYDGNYKSIYGLIDAGTFDVVRLSEDGDAVYIDDEGLLNDPEYFFTVNGQPLAGKGLVLGTDREGDATEPKMSLAELTAKVGWKRLKVDGFDVSEGETDHPTLGKVWTVSNQVKLSERS